MTESDLCQGKDSSSISRSWLPNKAARTDRKPASHFSANTHNSQSFFAAKVGIQFFILLHWRKRRSCKKCSHNGTNWGALTTRFGINLGSMFDQANSFGSATLVNMGRKNFKCSGRARRSPQQTPASATWELVEHRTEWSLLVGQVASMGT